VLPSPGQVCISAAEGTACQWVCCRESLVLEVPVGKFLDTSLIRADVQPRVVRLLIKGRLLQLVLPAEVGCQSKNVQECLPSTSCNSLQILSESDCFATNCLCLLLNLAGPLPLAAAYL